MKTRLFFIVIFLFTLSYTSHSQAIPIGENRPRGLFIAPLMINARGSNSFGDYKESFFGLGVVSGAAGH